MTRKLAIRAAAQQWTVGNEHAAGLQSFPPLFIPELTVQVNVSAVVAYGIRQDAGGTARRRRQPQSTVQDMVVNLLCPKSVPARIRKTFPVPLPSPGLIRQNSAPVHVIMCEANGVHHATSQPNRRVIPEWLFNIDPDAIASASFGKELHRRWILPFGSDDIQRPTQIEIEQRAPAPLVLSPHDVIKPVPIEADDKISGL